MLMQRQMGHLKLTNWRQNARPFVVRDASFDFDGHVVWDHFLQTAAPVVKWVVEWHVVWDAIRETAEPEVEWVVNWHVVWDALLETAD